MVLNLLELMAVLLALLEPGAKVSLSIVKADEKASRSNSVLKTGSEVSEPSVVLTSTIKDFLTCDWRS